MSEKKQIVILGGGFGGLYAALQFEKALARQLDIEVTLVNRDNFILFTPMLHEVAASDIDITHIVTSIRKLLRRVRFFDGEVEGIDLERKTVRVSHGSEHHDHELEYDHLVLALGSVTNFFHLPGLAERALTMKSLGDAIELRNLMIGRLEAGDFECALGSRDELLTFVVAGGGFAGVETAAAMNDFLREAAEFYPHLSQEQIRVILVHPGEVILPELGPKLGAYAQKKLSERKVEIRSNTRVTGISDAGVALDDGTTIQAQTLIWTAGISPNPILVTLACEKERGKVKVDENLEVPDWPGVWALGDCASIRDPWTGTTYPPTAQHALREGKTVAKNILAAIAGKRKRPFSFKTLGQLAAIGRRTGVANILGFNFSGFVAWWLWRSIYLSKLPGFERKLRVALDWTLDLVFSNDLVQFLTLRAPTVSYGESNQHDAVIPRTAQRPSLPEKTLASPSV